MAERVERYNPYGWQYQTVVTDQGAETQFSGSQAVDSNGNCIVVLGSTIYSLNTSGGVRWTNSRPGGNVGAVGCPPSILSDNTVVTGGSSEFGDTLNYFAASDGAWSYVNNTMAGDSPIGISVLPDDSLIVYGIATVRKVNADKTLGWMFRTPYYGLDPHIKGLVTDAAGYVYLWYDSVAGIHVYNPDGTFARSVTNTGDVVDPDTGDPITLQEITGVAFAEDGSLIVGVSYADGSWAGLVSLQSGDLPPPAAPPSTGVPIISLDGRIRGNGISTNGGVLPWGP
jgi:hypothetical protein